MHDLGCTSFQYSWFQGAGFRIVRADTVMCFLHSPKIPCIRVLVCVMAIVLMEEGMGYSPVSGQCETFL